MKQLIRAKSFRLLWKAVKESRHSMWISLQVLVVLTLVLATIFFFAEYKVQGSDNSYWKSIVWAFTRYIGDPGEFSDITPITITGRWMATLIGIVGILIFAVPAGLIGSAFTSAIEDDLHECHLEEVGDQLKKAFRRRQESKTMYKVIPRYISIGTLQAAKDMTESDIIDAVKHNSTFRLRNLATAEANGTHSQDQLVVEMFPLNTSYGCCIDRGSDISIVCPTAMSEAGIGNFAYYLALIGGFNYISKETDLNIDEPKSYYILSSNRQDANLEEFLTDLRQLAGGKDHWTVFLISSQSRKDTDLHFLTASNSKTGRESTILDIERFERLWDEVANTVINNTGVKADLNTLRPAGTKNIATVIGGGTDTNAFTIRVSSELTVWDPRYMEVARELANAIAQTLGNPERETTPDKVLKVSGFGY